MPDLTSMLGPKPDEIHSKALKKPLDKVTNGTPFVLKAAKASMQIVPHLEVIKSKSPQFFEFGRQ